MTTYSETGSGGAVCGGLATVLFVNKYAIAFGKGSVVYSRPKALKGILYKIVVRDWIINEDIIVYKDTLNGLWNGNELITHAEAIALAKAALEQKKANLTNYLNSLTD